MPRAHPPVVKAAGAARYIPALADPLNPLAQEVGKVVAQEMKVLNARSAKGTQKAHGDARIVVNIDELGAHITVLVAKILNQSLTSPTEEGKALRMALIAKLANAEIAQGAVIASAPAGATAADALLTTAEAAAKLEVSRPYVSMLCDAGKLGEVVMTEGGHRRIRSSAVDAYLTGRTRQHESAPSPRAAGVKAGLYDHPDGHFTNVVRGAPAVKVPREAAPVKAARKPRS
ncbi:excisionase family DNA-binding protein [Rhizobacter sp. Root1221]|uniref:excisionase family DNA-binding protein n=1 Tax=Rhizobacter sp. Root1221 TaxID=1736433 RepID=UPI0006F62DC9|nr:excisionase family DNA-binding protein [Rhizobacter sp. Root1221]KQV78285.1 hypothetical protein ASC87_11855 [Rhizobacter sp. Root1221]